MDKLFNITILMYTLIKKLKYFFIISTHLNHTNAKPFDVYTLTTGDADGSPKKPFFKHFDLL